MASRREFLLWNIEDLGSNLTGGGLKSIHLHDFFSCRNFQVIFFLSQDEACLTSLFSFAFHRFFVKSDKSRSGKMKVDFLLL